MSKPKFNIGGEIRKHKEQLALKKAEMRSIVTKAEIEKRELSEEEDMAFKNLEAEVEALKARVDRLEKVEEEIIEEVEEIQEQVEAIDGEERSAANKALETAFGQFLRRGLTGITPEQRQLVERRALNATTGNKGAYTIPQGFANKLEVALKETGGFLNVLGLIETATGNDIPYPTMNDTANEGVILGTTGDDTPTDSSFGVVTLKAFTYTSKPIIVSNELLEDSAFNLEQYLSEAMALRINRAYAKNVTTGNGTDAPQGIVSQTTKGADAAAAAITSDNLLDLIHSVDLAYRNNPSTGFMMTDNTHKALRKLKNTAGDYIYQESARVGEPATLFGYPVHINNDMDEIGTGKKSVVFGDLSKYLRRRVTSVGLHRLTELYAIKNQTAFVLFLRQDGRLIDAGTHPVKHLLHA